MTLSEGRALGYYLDEDSNWGLNADELLSLIKKAKDEGTNVRGIVVINPGNPTG